MNPLPLTTGKLSLLLLLWAVSLQAADEMTRFVAQQGSQVTIHGRNDAHEWEIQGSDVGGFAEFGVGFPERFGSTAKLGIVTAHLEGFIPVRSLHINEGKVMDRAIYNKLVEQVNPQILFSFGELSLKTIPNTNGASYVFDARGKLLVAGFTNQIVMPIDILLLGSNTMKITGTTVVRMTDFGIQPPELVLSTPKGNTLKYRDEVKLSVVWLLRREPSEVSAERGIPPFVAEGRLLTRGFRTDTNLNYGTDANVVFLYSNGWWAVEARYRYMNSNSGVTNVENCMRIPDGSRSYTKFEGGTQNGGTILASACPNPFPPPGRAELLVPWLSLCPYPALPLIDSRRMRRFINLPVCRPDIFNSPQNEGFYGVSYLPTENAFLSELAVTNNGFSVESTVTQEGLEGEIHRFPVPFENGFMEFEYKVIETTNLNGITFPLRTVCKHSIPDWSTKDPNDVRVYLVSEMTVARISFPEMNLAGSIVTPTELFAEDSRPPDLTEKTTVGYLVKGDHWRPISDPEIERQVRRIRIRAGR